MMKKEAPQINIYNGNRINQGDSQSIPTLIIINYKKDKKIKVYYKNKSTTDIHYCTGRKFNFIILF